METILGIIGAGALGSNLARAFAKAGISAVISNSRGPESLAKLVEELGPTIRAGTTLEAAKTDVVFLALRWADLKKVLGGLPAWNDASSSTARTPWNGSTRALRRRAIRPTRWPPTASRRSISVAAIR